MLQMNEISSYLLEVKVKQGRIIGIREETVGNGRLYYAFYGIPYAEKPEGKLRFKDPKPVKKWSEPFDATVEYHGACAQSHIVHKNTLFGNEDCLSLNIYSAHIPKEENRDLQPVAVWIHGYGFTTSLSHMFGGDSFLERNIVFVTVTHRVGVFGFYKANDSNTDGNMGLKDIVMALKWVRKNIKQFGGDRKRITVMGNDSGATFLTLLLMTKHKNMFSKMILQSGGIFTPSLFRGNSKVERERLNNNLRKSGYEDILTAPTKDIILASEKIYNNKEIANFQRPIIPFTPTVDKLSNDSFLTITPDEFYNTTEKFNITKSIMIGFNSAESISEAIPFLHNPRYLNYFKPFFKFMVPFSDGHNHDYTTEAYKNVANKIKHYYFKDGISEKSIDNFLRYTTDLKKYPIWKFIKRHVAKTDSKMYVYKFNYLGGFNTVKATSLAGVNLKVKGASNGDEICYILKCQPMGDQYIKLNNDPNNRDRKFMYEITEMWVNFIRSGKPTLNGTWPPMTLNEKNILQLGKVTKLIDTKSEERSFLFWEHIYASYYANNSFASNVHDEL
ncbi:unnamed protein product [Diatraea saccharalis]|uniref:Carboxylesterase type B domain-containing protein n=1 Tax=Diatraea saccharalis TaxID=40085 RepID=A0A9N9QSN6_9NEOP|nr:unnamed protein product [Diatraea saccharalis]